MAEWNNSKGFKASALLRALVLLGVFAYLNGLSCAWGARETKSILLLQEENPSLPFFVNFMSAFRPELVRVLNRPVTIYTENLDFSWFSSAAYKEKLSQWLHEKYSGRKLDAIAVGDEASLNYAISLRNDLWPGVPIIFTGISETDAARFVHLPNITGVTFDADVKGTLAAAARFCPNARSIAYVAGISSPYEDLEKGWRKDALEFAAGRYEWIDLTEYSLAETKSLLSALPPDTIVFYAGITTDGEENQYTARDLIPELSKASNAPIFSCMETFVGYGSVGGISLNPSALGVEMARQVATAVTAGNASTVPIIRTRSNIPVFDWRELQRWNLDENKAPPHSELRFRIPSVLEAYGDTIVTGLFLMISLLTLIGLLLWQRRERRLVENSLRESEEHMSIASDSADLGLWIWRPEDDRIWCTDTFNAFYGFPLEQDLTGKECLERIHPDDVASYKAAWSSITENNAYAEVEFRVILPDDDSERWLSSKGRARLDANGQLLRLMGVTMNITEHKLMAREIQERQDQLSHAMRVATMGELAGSLAHELNQPISAIMNNALAGRRFLNTDKVDLDEMRALINDIISDNERASQVIQRLYPLLRNEQHTFHPLAINTQVTEATGFIRNTLSRRGVTLSVELALGLPHVLGDGVQLQQVLINLCLNGAEAMQGLPAHKAILQVRTLKADDMILVTVTDRGHGVADEFMERVFEPFHSSKPNGLGMGLSISKSIVEAHGGRLWLENNPNGGASSHFTLRIVPNP